MKETNKPTRGTYFFGPFAICVGGLFSGHARLPPDVVV
jgi:hypothetical protein